VPAPIASLLGLGGGRMNQGSGRQRVVLILEEAPDGIIVSVGVVNVARDPRAQLLPPRAQLLPRQIYRFTKHLIDVWDMTFSSAQAPRGDRGLDLKERQHRRPLSMCISGLDIEPRPRTSTVSGSNRSSPSIDGRFRQRKDRSGHSGAARLMVVERQAPGCGGAAGSTCVAGIDVCRWGYSCASMTLCPCRQRLQCP
jgi:hypothetical protein